MSDLTIVDSGAVRILTLNRPESKNSLTLEVVTSMIESLHEAALNAAVRCVVITGSGGSFCSGLDLTVLQGSQDYAKIEHWVRTVFHGLIRAIRAVPKPVVALVDGTAVGFGCDLALACDLRVASDRVRFGEIFVKRGLMPDGGGSYTLPRLVGLGKAMELLLLGDLVDAEAALRLGLVNQVVPAAELAERGAAFAQRLAAAPPLVAAQVKDAVYTNLGQSFDASLERELRGQMQLLQSSDFKEGLAAFFEKRAPKFVGA